MRFETLVEKECEFTVYHILYHQLSLHISSTQADHQTLHILKLLVSNLIPENIKIIDFTQHLRDHYFTRFRL